MAGSYTICKKKIDLGYYYNSIGRKLLAPNPLKSGQSTICSSREF